MLELNFRRAVFHVLVFIAPMATNAQNWIEDWDSLKYYDNFLASYNPHYYEYSDSADKAMDFQSIANVRYEELIYSLCENEDFNLDKFNELEFISVSPSSDGKLLLLQFPENTGGTFEPWISLICINGEKRAAELFDSHYYYQPAEIIEGNYVFFGGVKGCTTCFGEIFSVYRIEGDSLVEMSRFEISGRGWHQRFTQLDSNFFKFRFEYDDMTDIYMENHHVTILDDFLNFSWEELEDIKNNLGVWPADSGYFHLNTDGTIEIDSSTYFNSVYLKD